MNKNIIIVDDSRVVRMEMKFLLKKMDVNLLEAHDKKSFLKVLSENEEDIHLVIMDLSLGDYNGYDLIEKMKENKQYKNTPIMVLTGNGRVESILKGQKLKVADYVIKPYNKIDMLDRINKILGE